MRRHDLPLRYKTTAERAFQREFRQLEQYVKSQKLSEKTEAKKNMQKEEAKQAAEPPGEVRTTPGSPMIRPPWVPKNERRRSRYRAAPNVPK
jgi:hypothetical protein